MLGFIEVKYSISPTALKHFFFQLNSYIKNMKSSCLAFTNEIIVKLCIFKCYNHTQGEVYAIRSMRT